MTNFSDEKKMQPIAPTLNYDDANEAVESILEVFDGGPGWYVGITDDPQRQLIEHGIEIQDEYTAIDCVSVELAREVRRILQMEYGYKGNDSRGDENSIFVYVYEISDKTKED